MAAICYLWFSLSAHSTYESSREIGLFPGETAILLSSPAEMSVGGGSAVNWTG